MLRTLFLLCCWSIAVGCTATSTVPGPSTTCTSDDDCPRPLSCLQGACLNKVCEPGELRCLGNDLEICGLDGQGFGLKTACQAGCDEETTSCTDPVCEPFATRCYEGKVEQCLANGSAWNLLRRFSLTPSPRHWSKKHKTSSIFIEKSSIFIDQGRGQHA